MAKRTAFICLITAVSSVRTYFDPEGEPIRAHHLLHGGTTRPTTAFNVQSATSRRYNRIIKRHEMHHFQTQILVFVDYLRYLQKKKEISDSHDYK